MCASQVCRPGVPACTWGRGVLSSARLGTCFWAASTSWAKVIRVISGNNIQHAHATTQEVLRCSTALRVACVGLWIRTNSTRKALHSCHRCTSYSASASRWNITAACFPVLQHNLYGATLASVSMCVRKCGDTTLHRCPLQSEFLPCPLTHGQRHRFTNCPVVCFDSRTICSVKTLHA